MGNPRPLTYRKLRKSLKKYGVIERYGDGSERIFILPTEPNGDKGPQYSVRCHGEGDEISKPVILALLRRFEISPNDFFD